MLRFQLLGFPIEVASTFWVIAFLLGARGSAIEIVTWMAAVFVSVLVHELGHALAFRRSGCGASIHLHMMGGHTAPIGDSPATRGTLTWISFAGPLAGFVFGGVVLLVQQLGLVPLAAAGAVEMLLWINFGWGLFNLLPMLPLDGGHILQALIGPSRRVAVSTVSLCIAGAVAYGGAVQGWVWIVLLAGMSGAGAFTDLSRLLGRGSDGLRFDPQLEEARAQLESHPRAARDRLAAIVAVARNARVRRDAAVLLAYAEVYAGDHERVLARFDARREDADPFLYGWLLLEAGRAKEALPLISRATAAAPWPDHSEVLLRAYLENGELDLAARLIDESHALHLGDALHAAVEVRLFQAGKYRQALRVSELRHRRFKTSESAYNAACSEARLGAHGRGLDWLETAVDLGWNDVEQLQRDEDLAALRPSPRFDQIVATAWANQERNVGTAAAPVPEGREMRRGG